MNEVTVRLPAPLRDLADGRGEVVVRADTLEAALAALGARYPTLRSHLFGADGRLRAYVNTYVNERDARALEGGATRLASGDAVTLVASIAGG